MSTLPEDITVASLVGPSRLSALSALPGGLAAALLAARL